MTLTREEFARGMAPVMAVWSKEKPPPETLEVYYRLLAHIPFQVFVLAAENVLRGEKSYGFPKPDQFHEAAVGVLMEQNNLSDAWARQTLKDLYWQRVQALSGPAPLQIGGEP